jgi:hypothetical protein
VSPDLGRRSFLLLGVGTLAAGCSAASTAGPSSSPSPTGPAAPPSRSPSASVAPLPDVTRWHVDPRDVEPAAKRAAVRTIERGGNTRRSALQVIDAQYGGIVSSSASVLVVCRSWARTSSGAVRPGGATYDVRLVRSGGWRVVAVHPSRPGPPARHVSEAARRVLGHPRIDLPPASRADVLSGRVHDSVLTTMLTLARRYTLGVSVVRSGHPLHVFGTSRLSDHPQGRAFDTWRIDGHPVVAGRTPRALVAGYMEAAAAAGSYNVGGPYLLGSAPQFFSDATHHDHVHAGFAS